MMYKIWYFYRKIKLFCTFLKNKILLEFGSVDPHFFADPDPDPESQNNADPADPDPDPKHWLIRHYILS